MNNITRNYHEVVCKNCPYFSFQCDGRNCPLHKSWQKSGQPYGQHHGCQRFSNYYSGEYANLGYHYFRKQCHKQMK